MSTGKRNLACSCCDRDGDVVEFLGGDYIRFHGDIGRLRKILEFLSVKFNDVGLSRGQQLPLEDCNDQNKHD